MGPALHVVAKQSRTNANPMGFVVEFMYPKGSRYLEVYGYYVSHVGGEWEGFREVKPKTVTVKTFV